MELSHLEWSRALRCDTHARTAHRLVLGDVCHASMSFHAKAIHAYTDLLPECDYFSPSNIEAETGEQPQTQNEHAQSLMLGPEVPSASCTHRFRILALHWNCGAPVCQGSRSREAWPKLRRRWWRR